MNALRYFVWSSLLVLVGLGAARAKDKVLVGGTPPLTQSMVNDYCEYFAWCWQPILDKVGGRRRLAQLLVNDWQNRDKARQAAILADLKWWREEFRKLSPAQRQRLRPVPEAQARLSPQEQEASHLLVLQQYNDATQLQIRALSNLQASHHETMMMIIRNMRPTGRYEYNPSTGRYDRFVP
jgi:hypothetical protein